MYKNYNHVVNQLVVLFQIYIVYSKRTGKPRGYAFIEYEHERDMHCEYHLCSPDPVHFCTDSIDIGQSSWTIALQSNPGFLGILQLFFGSVSLIS